MAQSGTLTQINDQYGSLKTTITGITQSTNSPLFRLRGYIYSGYVVTGVIGGATCQWQGSNDGGNTWISIGSTFNSLPANGTLTPSQQPYEEYQLLVTGGDGTTNLTVNGIATGTRG